MKPYENRSFPFISFDNYLYNYNFYCKSKLTTCYPIMTVLYPYFNKKCKYYDNIIKQV